MSGDTCVECGAKVPHRNASGRVSRWDVIRAAEKGWFFQHDGAAFCPTHVPDWVPEWRAGAKRRREQAELKQERIKRQREILAKRIVDNGA